MQKTATVVMMGAVLAMLVMVGGCSDDFGTPCDLPNAPEIAAFCGSEATGDNIESTATCVDPINPDCDSRLCVSFEGSDAFCSERCSSNGGCPSGAGCEFTLGASLGVCVPNRLID